MKKIDTLEMARYDLQTKLDAGKSSLERNILGQFHTPWDLACILAKYAKENIKRKDIKFLDPAFGTGTFYSALIKNNANVSNAQAYEIDPYYAKPTQELWGNCNVNITIGDFLLEKPKPEFDLLICNPPYVRHHHINQDLKFNYKRLSEENSGIKVSGLSGLYCHFVMRSDAWLRENGLAIWLIPSEFLDVNYGSAVKQFLLDNVDTIRIHKFDPENVQFSDALVTSSVVVFRKKSENQASTIEFTYGDFEKPSFTKKVSANSLSCKDKWAKYFKKEQIIQSGQVFGDLFKIRRGIATGANDFFILGEDVVKNNKIPAEFLKPILPSPRNLKTNIINSDSSGVPSNVARNFLISTVSTIEEIRSKSIWLANYLESGSETIANGFLCKGRTPWYAQESRQPSIFLSSYMGRCRKDGDSPIRFFWNRSKAIGTNSFLMIYPTASAFEIFGESEFSQEKMFKCIQAVTNTSIFDQTRSYGGGLFKLEPKELQKVRIDLNKVA